jgi:hypothetical protein
MNRIDFPYLRVVLAIFATAFTPLCVTADELERSFPNPPASAKPAIWWFWGESVTTDHGITQDLEALKRAGFGGVVVYEQLFTDRPGALKSLSPEWLARFRFAVAECARLGMTLEVNASNGYVAGGPWITQELGMQRLIASETMVDGGNAVSVSLPKPRTRHAFYRDVAVLAYPTPAGGETGALPEPVVTSEPAGVDLKSLFSVDGKAVIPPPADKRPVLIQFDYGRPCTVRSVSYSSRAKAKGLIIATQVPSSWADDFYGQGMRFIPPLGRIEASVDGVKWRVIRELPAFGTQIDGWTQRTAAFPATTARFFRLSLDVKDEDLTISGVALHGAARIDQWEIKSGNVADFSNSDQTPDYAGNETIDPAAIVDLTNKCDAEGKLKWDSPPGRWTILRLGHTPTGAKTKHGRHEGLGLECDKLSAAATKVQFENYVGVLLREARRVPGAKISGINIDSAEHGSQNWTADFEAQFEKRRGYSMRKYLPAMMGRVVANRETSDKFLFDVRRTIADLMSDEYFGTFQKLCHAEGMTSMAQAPGLATCMPSDNIQAKGRADIPMGEFWMSQPDGTIDCKEAASAAHVYGLPVAAAESFTGSRSDAHPAMMAPFANAALSLGINRFVVLAYIHQPWDDRKPGVTQDRFFLPYQRHNTWWDDGAGFWNSLTRSSHLMRKGHPVCDLLYHLGNDTPLKIATWRMRPVPPAGYDYDVCGDEVLIDRASVRDGRIVLPDGMSYRMLVLAGGNRMTLAAAGKLRTLVHDGAAVLGPVKPEGSPSLADGPAGDDEVRKIADELWDKGRVIRGVTPAAALASLKTPPDFEVLGNEGSGKFLHAHRRTDDAEIHFVANHESRGRKITALFRTTDRVPQRWDAATGNISALSGWREVEGRTEVPLVLEAWESAFIVFRKPGVSATKRPAPGGLTADLPVKQELKGPWSVRFSSGGGAPEQSSFPELISWSDHPDAGVRHFSGAAVYTKDFDLPEIPPGRRLILDLGKVAVLASVKINGRDLGVLWKQPFAIDVTDALRPGRNNLEIRVVNTWVNRLIGDAALPEDQRIAWATWSPFKPGDALPPSGLLGPVMLRSAGIP